MHSATCRWRRRSMLLFCASAVCSLTMKARAFALASLAMGRGAADSRRASRIAWPVSKPAAGAPDGRKHSAAIAAHARIPAVHMSGLLKVMDMAGLASERSIKRRKKTLPEGTGRARLNRYLFQGPDVGDLRPTWFRCAAVHGRLEGAGRQGGDGGPVQFTRTA